MGDTTGVLHSRAGRTIWLLLASPLVCTAIGCLIGATYVAVSLMSFQSVSFREALRGFPTGMLYSLIVAGPVGVVGGVLGALLATTVGVGVLGNAARRAWLRAGTSTGAVLGAVTSLFFVMTSAGERSLGAITLFALVCVLAGAVQGALVALLGWREFGSPRANG